MFGGVYSGGVYSGGLEGDAKIPKYNSGCLTFMPYKAFYDEVVRPQWKNALQNGSVQKTDYIKWMQNTFKKDTDSSLKNQYRKWLLSTANTLDFNSLPKRMQREYRKLDAQPPSGSGLKFGGWGNVGWNTRPNYCMKQKKIRTHITGYQLFMRKAWAEVPNRRAMMINKKALSSFMKKIASEWRGLTAEQRNKWNQDALTVTPKRKSSSLFSGLDNFDFVEPSLTSVSVPSTPSSGITPIQDMPSFSGNTPLQPQSMGNYF